MELDDETLELIEQAARRIHLRQVLREIGRAQADGFHPVATPERFNQDPAYGRSECSDSASEGRGGRGDPTPE